MGAAPKPEEQGPLQPATTGTVYDGLTIRQQPAPFFKRFLALAVDYGLLGAIAYGTIIVGVIVFGLGGIGAAELFKKMGTSPTELKHLGKWVLVALVLVFLLALMLLTDAYFISFEYKRGATPGKRLFGLKVVDVGNGRLTLGQCVLRAALRYIDSFLVLPGVLSVLLTERRQRLGDLAASTMVVHSRLSEESQLYMYVSQENYNLLTSALRPAPVPLKVARSFLTFSYRAFILSNLNPSESELARWEQVALSHIPQARAQGLDRQSLLLFFAEYCLHTANSAE